MSIVYVARHACCLVLYVNHRVHAFVTVTSLVQNHMVYINARANSVYHAGVLFPPPPRMPGYEATVCIVLDSTDSQTILAALGRERVGCFALSVECTGEEEQLLDCPHSSL